MREGWTYSERPVGGYWHHATLPVFVVHYPKTNVTGEHYQGYKAIERARPGAPVYSADNRRVGDSHGFETMDQAMAACEAAAGTKARWVRQSQSEGKKLSDWVIGKVGDQSKR